MTGRLLDDCFAHPSGRLTHDEALALLKARLSPVAARERVPLVEAHGRILAEDVTSPRAVPGFDNAAVDGYAFAHSDHEPTGGFMPVSMRLTAGAGAGEPLPPFTAARIFTGAALPPRANTVAMQEDCETHSQDGRHFVVIPAGLKPGANRRRAGEDLAEGATVAEAGRRLRPQDVGALASIGLTEAPVFARLRVALLSTGNEVARPGEALAAGGVYDANHYLLSALLDGLGAEVADLGIVGDDAARLRHVLGDAAGAHHAVLTTGGASRGEEDHLGPVLAALGRRHLWQLAVKPGRPMTFGQIGDAAVFGLPGNPVAAFVCFLLYVRPALSRMGGAAFLEPTRYPLPALFAMTKKPGRREFLRGLLRRDPGLAVDRFPRDGSGIITSLREADGLVELPEAVERVAPGDAVAFIPFGEFGI